MTGHISPRARVALFFLGLGLLGLMMGGGYGQPIDEPAEQIILRENLMEYACRFGDQNAVAYYDSLGVQRASESIERDHGQAAYYLFSPLLAHCANAPALLRTLWQSYTWLWFMAGVCALYALCRALRVSRPLSCAGAMMLYLAPRFFAEGHYNNKDMVLLSLVLLTLWLGARLLREPGFARGLAFSLAGALAANLKLVGVLPWGLIGLMLLARLTATRRWSARLAGVAATTVAGFAACYALLTPALWAGAGDFFAYLLQNATGFTRWWGVVIFAGQRYEQTIAPLPKRYLPVLIALTLPLYTLPLAAVGQLVAVARGARLLAKRNSRRVYALLDDDIGPLLAVLTLCWLTPLAGAVLLRPVLYNGWRHFYFLFAGIAPLAAYGLQMIADRLRTRGCKRLAACLLAACLTASAAGIAVNHPRQYAYYNLLANDGYEGDHWLVSTGEALARLASCPERNAALAPMVGARDPLCAQSLAQTYAALPDTLRARVQVCGDPDAPYLLLNTAYQQIYELPEPEGYRALLTLNSYGRALCTVYERTE